MITSFVVQKLHSTSFGNLLAMPDLIKRGRLPDGNGLCYMMPMTRDGAIDIVFGLPDEEDTRWTGALKSLSEDPLMMSFTFAPVFKTYNRVLARQQDMVFYIP